MQIGDPFKMTDLVNNFIDSPPFGLYDIFNFLICHSTAYDKQGLAAYKSFDDYRLFEGGYVESLLTKTLTNERLHVYVGKVRPAMKTTTDDGKKCYDHDLWFILEGKGTSRGSVLRAKCMCKGGRDGGCKHIGATMYSLEELLNTRGENSVTSGPCLWQKKPQSSTECSKVADLVIEKSKLPSHKLRKRDRTYVQHIDLDVRRTNDRKQPTKKKLRKLTKEMVKLENEPAIFPLFKKLYLPPVNVSSESASTSKKHECKYESSASDGCGIMCRKISALIKEHPEHNDAEVFQTLTFSDEEIKEVHDSTKKQCQSKEWYVHKAGFITASIAKQVFTRQATVEKNALIGKSTDVNPTLTQIINPGGTSAKKVPVSKQPQNPREWGLFHEESARKAYYRLERHNHHKLQLIRKGFLISKKKPFLGASLDNVRRCHCSTGCQDVAVEYKCPWKHKDKHPKDAFLSPEVGGVMKDNVLCLKSNSPYYYQIQMQLYVAGLIQCDLVIWTNQGIYKNQVKFDDSFITNVCHKLEIFWKNSVLPALIVSVSKSATSGMYNSLVIYEYGMYRQTSLRQHLLLSTISLSAHFYCNAKFLIRYALTQSLIVTKLVESAAVSSNDLIIDTEGE